MNKKMKNGMQKNNLMFIFGIFTVLFFASFIPAEEVNYSYSYSYEGVQVTSLKYEPYPVNPGEYFDVWFKVSLGSSVDYVKFELVDNFPFSIDKSEDSVREYDGASSREIVMHYKIRVDEDAVEGENELELKIITSKFYEGDVVSTFEIFVADAQTDFDLVLQDSSGSEISLAIANVGKNTANSMIVRVPSQEGYSVSGTSGQMVGNLDSGDYTIVSFEVSQKGRTEDPLKIQIDYTDNIGERRSVVKEINFGSGFVMNNSITEGDFGGEMPEGFNPDDFRNGNFPRQQEKAKWPYFLAVGVILLVVVFIVYQRNPRKFKEFFIKNDKPKSKKEKVNGTPDWMIKEIGKTRKR